VIANTENAAAGFGITPDIAEDLFEYGINVMTGGNHTWDKKEIVPYFAEQPRLLRPANYPAGTPATAPTWRALPTASRSASSTSWAACS
jgi:calcineurin-like phosphoesterase